jgi:transposase
LTLVRLSLFSKFFARSPYHTAIQQRQALYMPAIVARRYNPFIQVFCDRLLANGKSKMSMIGAAMHKLLRQVFGVLKSQLPFDPNFLSLPS